MFKQTPKSRVLFAHRFKPVLLVLFGVFSLLVANLHAPRMATAATANTINFQARLQTASGAIVPDGFYNVEFKLYSASSGGTALWTEDYLVNSSQGLKTVNGYLSAKLGSVTAFPAINWDQQLWMTMNIGGTGTTASWDGEMNPRLALTAVPYAFSAGQLAITNGANRSTLSIQAPTGGNQNFVIQDQGAAGTYNLLTTNTANNSFIQLQSSTPGTAQTGNFNITGTGIAASLQAATVSASTSVSTSLLDTASATALNIGTTNATQINLNQNLMTAADKGIVVQYGSGNTNAFTVNNTGNTPFFNVDTTNSKVTIGTLGGCVAGGGTSGKFCVNQNAGPSATGTVTVTNTNLTISNTSAGTQYANVIAVTDTSTVANSTYGLFIDSSGSTNTAGTMTSIRARIASGVSGNFLQFQSGSSGILTIGNNGNINTVGYVDGANGFRVNGTSGSTTTCSSGNVLQNTIVQGGIITGGTCVANGGGVAPTLQDVYNNSGTTNPQIQTTTANGGLKLRDASTTVGNILQIQNSTGASTYFAVTNAGASTITLNASTSVLTPTIDTISSGILNIGSTNATQINLNKKTIIGSGTLPTLDGGTLQAVSGAGSAGSFTSSSIIAGTNGTASLFLGSSANEQNGAVRYNNSNNTLSFYSNSTSNAALTLGSTGSALFKNNSNATTAFQIQNAAGTTNALMVDTTGSTGVSIANTLSVGAGINAVGGYSFNGTAGSTTTCSAGNVLSNAVVQGGIITGGTCVANGGGTSGVTLQATTPGTADTGNFNISGSGLAANFLTSNLDTRTAGALTIGTNAANAITIGKTGVTTTVNGTAAIGTIDNSGTLNIGASTATAVNLGTANAAASAVTVGSTNSGSSALLQGSSANISLQSSGVIINGSTIQYKIGGTAVYTIDSSGRQTVSPVTDGIAFRVQKAGAGAEVFNVDTSAMQVNVTGLLNIVSGNSVQVNNGYLTLGGTISTNFLTPGTNGDGSNGASVGTKINVPIYNPGGFSQIVAMGLPSSAPSSARVISLFDARTSAHQPTISVFDTSESNVFGLSWDGSTTTGYLKNSANNVALQANNLTVLTASNNSGAGLVSVNGTINASGGFQFNGTAGSTTSCTGGNVLQNTVVQGGIITGGTCVANGGGVASTLQTDYNNSSSPATILLADAKDFVINAAATATDPNILFNLQCTSSCGSNGRFAVQNAGTDFVTVNPNGTMVIGNATNNITFASNGSFTFNGSAKRAKSILLTAEYAGAVLDAGTGTNNTGTMTSGIDLTNRMNYYKWTTTQGTNQSYDVDLQVQLPSDFDSWTSSNSLVINSYTSDTTNGTVKVETRDSSGVVSSCNFASITPASTTTWTTSSACSFVNGTGSFVAGNYVTIRVRLQAPASGDTRVGNIVLNYNSKY